MAYPIIQIENHPTDIGRDNSEPFFLSGITGRDRATECGSAHHCHDADFVP
jgi:hypothetical protein